MLTIVTPEGITIPSPSFSEIAGELFELFTSISNVNQLLIKKKELVFTQHKPGYLNAMNFTVVTEQPIDHLELIAFLSTPNMPFFGSEAWLYDRLDQFQDSLGLFSDGPRDVKVITELSS